MMDQLWAPWRLAYIAKPAPPQPDECFICTGLAANMDRENLIVRRAAHTAVLLNRFPYNNGHLLVAPLAHKARIQNLSTAEMLELMQGLQLMTELIDKLMKPEGYNIGLNLGRTAGAGLPGHLHWHIVPRWNGDTNFMPVLGDTKVINQSLDSLWQMLREHCR